MKHFIITFLFVSGSKYCLLLEKGGGIKILNHVIKCTSTNEKVKSLARLVLFRYSMFKVKGDLKSLQDSQQTDVDSVEQLSETVYTVLKSFPRRGQFLTKTRSKRNSYIANFHNPWKRGILFVPKRSWKRRCNRKKEACLRRSLRTLRRVKWKFTL